MPGATEEIKVLITADAGKLNRELTGAEKAVMHAKGVVQSASGAVSASSKTWTAYRTAAVNEMNKALAGVRKVQAKIAALKEQQMQASGLSDADLKPYINASRQMGASDSDIQAMIADMRRPSPAVQKAYEQAQSELQNYKNAADEAAKSVEWLNQKVSESQFSEQRQAAEAKAAAQRIKDQAKATREAATAHTGVAKSSGLAHSGLARFGRTALLALIGVRTLYLGLRKLVTAMLEAAKADSSLSTSLGQIKGNLSIAFQTVYQAALPALRALASMLATVTGYIASFLSMIFNVSWASASQGAQDYASSVSAAGGAAKSAAQNMMTFDELNMMDSESGGGGGGGISPIYNPDPEKPAWLVALVEWLEPVKEAFKGLSEAVKGFFNALKEKLENSTGLQKLKEGLTDIRDALVEVINWLTELFANPTFQALVAGVIEIALYVIGTTLSIIAEIIQFIVALLNGDGQGAVLHLLKAFVEAGRLMKAIFITIYHVAISVFQGIAIALNTFIADLLDAVGLDTLAEKIRGSIDNIKKDIEDNGAQFEIDLAVNETEADNALATIEGWFGGASESTEDSTEKVAALRQELDETKNSSDELGTSLEGSTSAATEALTQALQDTPTVEAAKQLGADLMQGLKEGIAEHQELASAAMQSAAEETIAAFKDTVAQTVGASGTLSSGMYQEYEALGEGCAEKFLEGFEAKLVETAKETIKEIQTRFQEMMTQLHYDLADMMEHVNGDARAMVEYINEWLGKIKSNVTITIDFVINGLGGSGLGLSVGSGPTTPTLTMIPQAAASGGVFSSGQLILAREAGPEIIGSIGGGRTGVMNNNQIVESVSNGVYQAVVDAMNTAQSSETGDFVVNVDGRELLRVTRQAERTSGYRISGNPKFVR